MIKYNESDKDRKYVMKIKEREMEDKANLHPPFEPLRRQK